MFVVDLQFAEALAKFIETEKLEGLRIWTSLMKRSIETVESINVPKENWKALNELDAVKFHLHYFNKFRNNNYIIFATLSTLFLLKSNLLPSKFYEIFSFLILGGLNYYF